MGGPPNRKTYTSKSPAKKVVINAIIDNPKHGDERNFLLVRTHDSHQFRNTAIVAPGDVVEFYMYFHNNAASRLNTAPENGAGIARDMRASIDLPTQLLTGKTAITATISATNAEPRVVWDECYLESEKVLHIKFIPGTAVIHSGGRVNGRTLPTSLFSPKGTHLGYNELRGALPGCADFAGYILFKADVSEILI